MGFELLIGFNYWTGKERSVRGDRKLWTPTEEVESVTERYGQTYDLGQPDEKDKSLHLPFEYQVILI